MRIWFNHWFSTAYHLINLMRKKEPERFVFIGSGTNPDSIYKQACTEFYLEDQDVSDEEYLNFCLEFCLEHGIDVFVPRHNLVQIIKNADSFEKIGVRLLAEKDGGLAETLDDKMKTYELIQSFLPDRVPPAKEANSVSEFVEAVRGLSESGRRVCYKLIIDEGARSFRVIDDRIEGASGIYNKPGSKITMESTLKVLKEYDFRIPLLVMPYLEDAEISVDCLKTASGNIIIPRFKSGKRYSEVIFEKDIMDECGQIIDRLNLQMPANIQYKKSGGRPYLLEINTRMSGGLQLSCEASKINVPMIALYKLLGEDVDWKYPDFKSRKVANIETPICL